MAEFIDLTKQSQEKLVFDKPGEYVVFMHNLSGLLTVELAAPRVEVDIYGLFTGKNADQFVINTTQHHTAPGSVSNLLIKGVFDDESKFNYQGLIRIEKSAQQSHAYQKNQNIILSSKTYVESKPFLEILANDVFCTHGSTTGKLSEDDLFYVESRGLDKAKAKDLLIQGFIDELYEKIKQKVPKFTPSGK